MIRRPPRSTQSRSSAASDVYKRQAQTGAEWMARAGNLSVLLCFAGSLAVNAIYFDGSESSIFLLAPIFLLLETKDTFLEGAHRYFVPVLVCTGGVSITVIAKLHFGFILRYLHLPTEHCATSTWFLIAQHTIVLLVTLPSHYHTLEYLWFKAAQSTTQLWLCLLYTSPSPRDRTRSRMPSSA
eukprot:TRINITY_DN4045_c0_g1_i1.p1 TRINITY_DN4045_c0_g1~~TRINITY_DN4045_c0_g1_i1.p1  ORF type:complete len:183 (+),score=67.23 TRINITY_DN4045_c0_g1_i1:106-654(+)